MTKKIIQALIALALIWISYRIYKLEQRTEQLQRIEVQCKKPSSNE